LKAVSLIFPNVVTKVCPSSRGDELLANISFDSLVFFQQIIFMLTTG